MMKPLSDIQYLRAQDIATRLGIGRATWYAWLNTRSDMPQPIKLSPRCVVWAVEDINAFIENNRMVGGNTHE